MTAIKQSHLKALEPYIESAQPSLRGPDQHRELDMHCPLHEDVKRSATLDLDKGLWYCGAGCGGGRVVQLIRQQNDWVEPPNMNGRGPRRNSGSSNGKPQEEITEAKIKGWMASLQDNPKILDEFQMRRGLSDEIIRAYEIGWDSNQKAFTIPIRDADGTIVNLRRYQLDPSDDRRKIWSVAGMGSPPRLYPLSTLTDDEPDEVIVVGGEWDALLTIQHGFHAITRTASEMTWVVDWGNYFKGKTVYLCHDADHTGRDANKKIARMLKNVCDVRIIELPYTLLPKHGKDLSDFWLEGHDEHDFRALMGLANSGDPVEEITELDPTDATVLDTFDSRKVGQPLKVTVTIKGKRDPGYTIPAKFKFSCTRDAGQKCTVCALNGAGGDDTMEVKASDPFVLELMESSKGQIEQAANKTYGIPSGKCAKLHTDVIGHQAVEVLFARPSVEHSDGESGAHKNVKITSVGRHDTMPNNTIKAVGALHPDPRKQTNEFLAWEVKPIKTSLDTYEVTAKDAKRLLKFQPRTGERPLKRLGSIARDLENHVTRIYGRPEMHAAMDLVFHSVLAFDFGGQRIDRGWLEGLFVGDTRTGKSEAASRLVRHYHAGEIISCESASFAGIVGGLQQYGGGKEWAINWGAIPINDRRLVVLDEISGLTPEEIAAMSDVRSRGLAQLTKIQQEATHARTRLIWIGNPRDARMADFTYGVQSIKPLIGNPEDIARFDLAMSATAGEVPAGDINRAHVEGKQKFNSDDCATLVRWVWSRTAEQVKFTKGATEAVYAAAQDLGSRYVEDPPLIQVANVRIKVARMAAALAARLFSTDRAYEDVLVRREHVKDVVEFLDRIYGMPGFGYGELSGELLGDRQEAKAKRKEIKRWLAGRQGLSKFLRGNSTFKRQDLEEVMNVPREEANAIISTLWEARMVSKNRGFVRVEPSLHELLREVKI